MKISELNSWLSLIANVGVLIGIVFLVIEVNQNQVSLEESNTINRLEASEAALLYLNGFRDNLIQNPEAARIWRTGLAGDDLSEDEQFIFDNLCANNIWNFVMAHERYDVLGRATEAQAMAHDIVRGIRNSPGYRSCWERMRRVVLDTGYVKFVTEVDESDK